MNVGEFIARHATLAIDLLGVIQSPLGRFDGYFRSEKLNEWTVKYLQVLKQKSLWCISHSSLTRRVDLGTFLTIEISEPKKKLMSKKSRVFILLIVQEIRFWE